MAASTRSPRATARWVEYIFDLKNWEQGRRHPDAPAAAYLLAIKRRPKEIMEAVAR
jgi:hypothetical protein